MKKIFQIAGYDFRRIMLNPITLVIVATLMAGCLILGSLYQIPATPVYSATTLGESPAEIIANFSGNNPEIDTKASLDNLLTKAENSLNVMKTQPSENAPAESEYARLLQIKSQFDAIEDEFRFPTTFQNRKPKYIEENDISEIIFAANELRDFVQKYEKKDEFESTLFFTKQNFTTLKTVSSYFSNLINQNLSIAQVVDDIYGHLDMFEKFEPTALTTTWWVDDEKLSTLQTIVENAKEKVGKIFQELSIYSSITNASSVDKVTSLLTNYKLMCESANFVVKSELKLLLSAHFGDLDKLFGYTNVSYKEDLRQDISKAKFFLQDENLYFTEFQEPLNFNKAANTTTAYDNAYFLLSIIGFLTIVFGIFCAYKLFGRDRRNGKMDLILSQNVTYGQVFAGKFTAIVLCTTSVLAVFMLLSLLWSVLFYPTVTAGILAIFNLTTPYVVHPILFLLLKFVGIEMQVVFWAVGTIFLMNISRKFELTFAISLLIFAISVICNIFLNGFLVYCLFPFVHVDLTAFLGGGSMGAGFLQTALYSNGNFFISLAYYFVVVVLLYNFTNQLFRKN